MCPEVQDKNFLKMLDPLFEGKCISHVMAVLKRSVVIVAGQHAVYVRLPSQHVGQRIHRFKDNGVSADWLVTENKPALASYRQGVRVEYDGFNDNLAKEAQLVEEWMKTDTHVVKEEGVLEGVPDETLERWQAQWELTPLEQAEKANRLLLEQNVLLRSEVETLKKQNNELLQTFPDRKGKRGRWAAGSLQNVFDENYTQDEEDGMDVN
ncbi:MAG: hypothetical protein VXY99_07670 [Pseudomonadota bacterium]|nr:hypothetical protein [Pseudomonadota bacterium]